MNDDDKIKMRTMSMDDPGYWTWMNDMIARQTAAREARGKLEPSYAVGEKIRFASYEGYVRSIDTSGLFPVYEVVGLMRNGMEVAGLVELAEEDPGKLVPTGGDDIGELMERVDGPDPYVSSL